jgi:hypothetical protein
MTMPRDNSFPENLARLHIAEERCRKEALNLIAKNDRMRLHLDVIEAGMGIANILRQFSTDEQNLRVIQLLGLRTFNAFGASLKLALSGYGQNSALIMRDVLETVFLIDYFSSDRNLIERWRFADKKARRKEFSPVKVRDALDKRDGFTRKKRCEIYDMFSELAGHPNMNSSLMLRPQRGGDILIGPFVEATGLEATLGEMGYLAVQVGENLDLFFPADWDRSVSPQLVFAECKQRWMTAFYQKTGKLSRYA